MTGPSSVEIFAAMGEALGGDDGMKLKKKFKACVLFVIDNNEAYIMDAKNTGTVTKISSSAEESDEQQKGKVNNNNVDLTVRTSLSVLQQLLEKKITPQQAFLKGKLKIKGKMNLAMKLTIVVNATRKKMQRKSKL